MIGKTVSLRFEAHPHGVGGVASQQIVAYPAACPRDFRLNQESRNNPVTTDMDEAGSGTLDTTIMVLAGAVLSTTQAGG